ncbi:glucan biosynthesis protein [Ahrensia sp. 13_GOM-1096m]|uniref:glucan biosynthesis protein n=1 Tax=Ahrensia sp. 13_GOM-1096m TaxID=1380380 RepID=UPI0004794A67|nr:glucan biosynthesis protein G [Ahrensia sp. 13_GOM-1096m]
MHSNLSDRNSLRQSTLSRRGFIAALAATTTLAFSTRVLAQDNDAEVEATAQEPFSFAILIDQMRELSSQDYVEPTQLGQPFNKLSYDDYRKIQFNPKHARWNDEASQFQLHGFHPGWLYRETVALYEVNEGAARPLNFTAHDFKYYDGMKTKIDPDMQLPGIAGFRINNPLNRLDKFDELMAFVGASYFRALGRGNAYGMSARGLSIDTGLSTGEEFPRFTAFWVERPAANSGIITLYAALESPSVTGAYKFVVDPGEDTVMDVECKLFFRKNVKQLGIAPLTSMFLYSHVNRSDFDDYRPQVHDSDGLLIERKNGDKAWRALSNPKRLSLSYFSEHNLKAFGLYQRARDFDEFQDVGARYHERPSVRVELVGDWPNGSVRLLEIPANIETDDNIGAFWSPDKSPKAGEELTFAYRLHWGGLPPEINGDLAYVDSTRSGVGGFSGVSNPDTNVRKFVIDFIGGNIANLPYDPDKEMPIKPVVTASAGEIKNVVLSKVSGKDMWRLVFDLDSKNELLLELTAHIAGYESKLSEVWHFQWTREQ